MSILRLKGVCVTRHGRTLLDVSSLEVPAGQVIAIMGPNGAGKSTLLRSCVGLQQGMSGHVELLGTPLHSQNAVRRTRMRRLAGYLPQLVAPPGDLPLTAREIVAIGRTGLRGLCRPLTTTDWQCVDQWIERLGLGALARRSYGELSGGQQRRVLLARVLVQQPKLPRISILALAKIWFV